MSAGIEELADIPSTGTGPQLLLGPVLGRGARIRARGEEHVERIFAYAAAAGRKVTCRGGGHAFDGQSLGDDLVISMARIDSIEVSPDERRVTVGAGASWGAIVAALEPHGLVPRVTVTTEDATAGGTLAGDCLSRFSPAWGKEGEAIESFTVVTAAGETITAVPPDRGVESSDWTKDQRVFCGVIGGLGYLGAVTEVTYHRLLRPGKAGGQIAVRTQVHKFDSFEELAKRLLPRTRRMRDDAECRDPDKLDAVWCALDTRGKGGGSVLWFTSAFDRTTERKRMLLHRPRLLLRLPVEWLMRVTWISKRLWPLFFRLYREGSVWHDDLEGFTFFMDGNARAKRWGRRFGFAMRNIQQTFVVPLDPNPAARGAEEQLVAWLEHAHAPSREKADADDERRPLPAAGLLVRAFGELRSAGLRGQLRVRDLEQADARAGEGGFHRPRGRPLERVRRARLPGQERVRPQGDALADVRRARGRVLPPQGGARSRRYPAQRFPRAHVRHPSGSVGTCGDSALSSRRSRSTASSKLWRASISTNRPSRIRDALQKRMSTFAPLLAPVARIGTGRRSNRCPRRTAGGRPDRLPGLMERVPELCEPIVAAVNRLRTREGFRDAELDGRIERLEPTL